MILMTAGTQPLPEAMAEHPVFINCQNTLLAGQRMLGKVKSARHPARRYAILFQMISFVSLMITGAHGKLQNQAYVQSCICAVPHTWKTCDYAVQALAVIILAAIAAIGVLIASRVFPSRPLAPAIPITTSFQNPADVPAIPAPLQQLPVIPAVQGEGDDIDDVLARSPIPTRLNSPLTWL